MSVFQTIFGYAVHCSGHNTASACNNSSDLWVNSATKLLLPQT